MGRLNFYKKETNYNTSKNSFDYPTVAYVEENEEVKWMTIKDKYKSKYLTFTALESGTFTVRLSGHTDGGATLTSLSYSLDNGDTWTTSTTEQTFKDEIYIELETTVMSANDTVLFKGVGSAAHATFTTNTPYNAYGNPMSLFYGDDFRNVTELWESCFVRMFSDTPIVSAQNLYLDFTTLASSCYYSMFYGCTSLTTAPVLPATTLASSCYKGMFQGCTGLTTAPELPATTLASSCYQQMFYGCSSLNYIKAMFTTTPSTSYTQNWVNGVAATGTFVKNSAATWDLEGVNGVPTGWTVQTASE